MLLLKSLSPVISSVLNSRFVDHNPPCLKLDFEDLPTGSTLGVLYGGESDHFISNAI